VTSRGACAKGALRRREAQSAALARRAEARASAVEARASAVEAEATAVAADAAGRVDEAEADAAAAAEEAAADVVAAAAAADARSESLEIDHEDAERRDASSAEIIAEK
jgi:hypothetical protein